MFLEQGYVENSENSEKSEIAADGSYQKLFFNVSQVYF